VYRIDNDLDERMRGEPGLDTLQWIGDRLAETGYFARRFMERWKERWHDIIRLEKERQQSLSAPVNSR
jgi:hypothetical protein